MEYKEKLEQAVKEFQPEVEKFFDVNLGEIKLKPKEDLDKTSYKTYAGAYFLILGKGEIIPTDIIFYNPSISNLISQSLANYIATHEMCHIGHAKYVGSEKYISSEIFREVISNYVTYELFNKKNQEIPKESILEEITQDVFALKEHLSGIGKNLKEYLNDKKSIFYDKEILKKQKQYIN